MEKKKIKKWTYNSKIATELKGSCAKQDKATFTNKNVANLFIAYDGYMVERFTFNV